ncbi:unnamed protein product, partial [Scytosiphon promiscuus]
AFAQKLHARGFPYVSILEGGMEGIVEHLEKEGSPLEPTVIDHDPEAYRVWREAQARRRAAAQPPHASRAGEAFSWRGEGHTAPHANGYGNTQQHQNTHAGGEGGGRPAASGGDSPFTWIDGSSGGEKPAGQSKVGVLDRLGLVRVREGVSLGVGTVAYGVGSVARTGARAVRDGAGMIIPSSLSGDGGGGGDGGWMGVDGIDRRSSQDRDVERTDSGNIWDAADEGSGGGGGDGGG